MKPSREPINFAEVSIPSEQQFVEDPTLFVAVLFSYIPWMLAVFSFYLIIRRPTSMRNRGFAFFVVLTIGISEYVFKPIAKQPRPPQSLLKSTGMPSSHAALAVGSSIAYAVLVFKKGFNFPAVAQGLENAAISSPTQSHQFLQRYQRRWPWRKIAPKWAAAVAVAVGVPWSRVALHDHSPAQVAAGSLWGFVTGTAYVTWLIRRRTKVPLL